MKRRYEPIKRTSELDRLVEEFYRENFWDEIKGDNIPDQNLANLMFDVSVNGGVYRGVSYLQRALNLCNRGEKDYNDLEVDGKIGSETLDALRKYLLKKRDINVLMLYYSAQMITHWMDRAEKIESQEEAINGIGNRWVANIKHIADKYYLS